MTQNLCLGIFTEMSPDICHLFPRNVFPWGEWSPPLHSWIKVWYLPEKKDSTSENLHVILKLFPCVCAWCPSPRVPLHAKMSDKCFARHILNELSESSFSHSIKICQSSCFASFNFNFWSASLAFCSRDAEENNFPSLRGHQQERQATEFDKHGYINGRIMSVKTAARIIWWQWISAVVFSERNPMLVLVCATGIWALNKNIQQHVLNSPSTPFMDTKISDRLIRSVTMTGTFELIITL